MNAPRLLRMVVFCSSVFFTTIGYISATSADPHGYMGQMDDSMERMMNERGYGYGYGYGEGGYGRHGGYGSMMGPMGGMMGPMGGMMMGYLAGLDLTDKQQEKIRDIQRDMRKNHFGLMESMMDTSDKLYKLYDADKPDPDKIGKVYDEIYKIKRKMIQEHIEIRNKIYDLLTKEQREKFKNNSPFAHRFGMMF